MFRIDLQSRIPIYEQVYHMLVEMIAQGELKEGDQLPSVRSLSKEMNINPNTISKAYQALERDKVIYSILGRGSFVADIAKANVHNAMLEEFDQNVEKALKSGLSKDTLLDHVESVAEKFNSRG